ncbi:MAG: hypothetical protein LM580_07495, partial [Thermofilum sp.]|nr:hypothetical protein [Thermofilum sp.]
MALALVRGMRRAAIAVLLLQLLAACAVSAQPQASSSLESLLDTLDVAAVQRHAQAIAGFGSRLTGYPGYYRAIDYIVQVLRSEGLEPAIQSFTVLVPWDAGSAIRVPALNVTI